MSELRQVYDKSTFILSQIQFPNAILPFLRGYGRHVRHGGALGFPDHINGTDLMLRAKCGEAEVRNGE